MIFYFCPDCEEYQIALDDRDVCQVCMVCGGTLNETSNCT